MTTAEITDAIDLSNTISPVDDGIEGVTGNNMAEWKSNITPVSVPANTPIRGSSGTYYEYDKDVLLYVVEDDGAGNYPMHVVAVDTDDPDFAMRARQDTTLEKLAKATWYTYTGSSYYYTRGKGKGAFIDNSSSPSFHTITDPSGVGELDILGLDNDRKVEGLVLFDVPGSYRYLPYKGDVWVNNIFKNKDGIPQMFAANKPIRLVFFSLARNHSTERAITAVLAYGNEPFTIKYINYSDNNQQYIGQPYSAYSPYGGVSGSSKIGPNRDDENSGRYVAYFDFGSNVNSYYFLDDSISTAYEWEKVLQKRGK
jgi:hypothetical protein